MKLSKDEIEKLFAFTKRKMVHWYDLQVEIVDHLAERIEEEMTLDESLNFDAALNKVYAGFGIFGFAKIVQEREKTLHSLGKKNFYKAFLQQLGWPSFVKTMFIFLVAYTLCCFLTLFQVACIAAILLTTFCLISLYKNKVVYKMKRKLLILRNPLGMIFSMYLNFESQFLFYLLFVREDYATFIAYPIIPTLFISFGFYVLIAYNKLTIELKEKAKIQYPDAFA